jgi:hypothetical protein
MLGIDCQRAERREAEPGTYPGVFGSRRGDRVCSEGARRGLRLGDTYSVRAGVLASEPGSEGTAATAYRQDDGLSRAQVTRLIARSKETGKVQEKPYRRNSFQSRYTKADIELLAAVHEAHGTLSGPATQKVLYRESHGYGDRRYERLAEVSVAHIYNLRKNRAYRERKVHYKKTRPVQVANRRAAPSRSAGQAPVPADGHGASGRPGRRQVQAEFLWLAAFLPFAIAIDHLRRNVPGHSSAVRIHYAGCRRFDRRRFFQHGLRCKDTGNCRDLRRAS